MNRTPVRFLAEEEAARVEVDGAARIVPGHSGKDWAAEIGNGVIRMKEETQRNRKRITKNAHASRGLETIWEMSNKSDVGPVNPISQFRACMFSNCGSESKGQ